VRRNLTALARRARAAAAHSAPLTAATS
jgi:hypothetical protein